MFPRVECFDGLVRDALSTSGKLDRFISVRNHRAGNKDEEHASDKHPIFATNRTRLNAVLYL